MTDGSSKYLFTTSENLEDFASNRVLVGYPGSTAFPVRLAFEIFSRAVCALADAGRTGPYTIYDPCAGAGYLLSVIALRFGSKLKEILASDIDSRALEFAQQNLALCNPGGLQARIKTLRERAMARPSEATEGALASGLRIEGSFDQDRRLIPLRIFEQDIFSSCSPALSKSVDLLITDLPHGRAVDWVKGPDSNERRYELLSQMLSTVLAPKGVAIICSGKESPKQIAPLRRLELLKLGHRQMLFLQNN